jgi:CheY-like chemotaxis protein
MSRVLIVEDSRTQAQQIQLLLLDAQYEVEVATHGRHALDHLRQRVPDIVLTDLEMPVMNGLELVQAVRREFPWVPVVLMTAHGSEEIASLALRKGAASYVPKAYLEKDIVPTLERILELTKVDRHLHFSMDYLRSAGFHFVLPNDAASITPILGYLDDLFDQVKLCDAADRMRTGIALQEALLNAIYHGNLEVSSDLRQQDEKVYHDLAERRRQELPYKNRRVFLDVQLSDGEAAFTVRDEGPGFDPRQLLDPTDPANLERVGGRGLLLIHTFMDRVTHNARGNEINMHKHRVPPSSH